jgi:hypothetical protein
MGDLKKAILALRNMPGGTIIRAMTEICLE